MDCGVGNLDHQSSIHSPESLTASSVSAKTLTARCSLAGKAQFTVSLMAKLNHIQSPEERARSVDAGCFVTARVVCGLELSTRGSSTYTTEKQMYLDCQRASQAKRPAYFLRIAKAISR